MTIEIDGSTYDGILATVLCGREWIHRTTSDGLIDTALVCTKKRIPFYWTHHAATAPIELIRSEVANLFIHTTTAEWLLFIDDDIGFMGKDVMALLDVEEHLVIGACPFREMNPKNPLMCKIEYDRDGKIVYNNYKNAVRVSTGGMGFTLIHRKVFSLLVESYGHEKLAYTPPRCPDNLNGKRCYHYFDIIFEGGQVQGEDVSFITRYGWTGRDVWMALDTNLTHSGMHTFTYPKPIREFIA